MTWDLESERRLLADACRNNLELFCRKGLGFTHPDNEKGRWWADEVHKPLLSWLQSQYTDWLATRRDSKERRYIAVLVPRACAKSLLITKASMLWLHLRDPNLSTYIGNEKLELAEDFLRVIRKWLEGTTDDQCLFNWLYGNWKGPDKRWRSDVLTHTARTRDRETEPSFGIWSPNSALTGRHPDILCMDDLVSYDALQKNLNWFEQAYGHMTDLIPVVESNGLVILVGTRYSDADPFGRCFKNDGIASLTGHTQFPEYQPCSAKDGRKGQWHVFFLSGETKAGEPAIPSVWSAKEIANYKARDPVKAASQVLNRPLAHKLRPLTEEQFDACRTDGRPVRATVVFHLDTAFKTARKQALGSETAFVVCAHHDDDPGVVTVLDCYTAIDFNAETYASFVVEKYKEWSALYRIMGITDEAEMAGKAGLWHQYLSDRLLDAGIPDAVAFHAFNRQQGERKEVRISNALAFVARKQVRFLNSATHIDALRYQLCNQPQAFPNDLADAFADTFNPEFFSGILPKLRLQKETYPWAPFERSLRNPLSENDDIMDYMDFGTPLPRRGLHLRGASPRSIPFSEQGDAPPALYIPRPR